MEELNHKKKKLFLECLNTGYIKEYHKVKLRIMNFAISSLSPYFFSH